MNNHTYYKTFDVKNFRKVYHYLSSAYYFHGDLYLSQSKTTVIFLRTK